MTRQCLFVVAPWLVGQDAPILAIDEMNLVVDCEVVSLQVGASFPSCYTRVLTLPAAFVAAVAVADMALNRPAGPCMTVASTKACSKH